MKVNRYSRIKMFFLYVLTLFVNLAPLIIVLIVNWGICTKTTREGVAISVTGILWFCFLVVSMLGTLPAKINRVATSIIVFVVLELMKPLLSCMCLFAGAAAIGAIIDLLFVRPCIKRYGELRIASTTADLTTQQVKQAVKELLEERSARA